MSDRWCVTLDLQPGDIVVLSDEGRRELPALRKMRGVVIEKAASAIEGCFIVEWGARKKYRLGNHWTNLRRVT